MEDTIATEDPFESHAGQPGDEEFVDGFGEDAANDEFDQPNDTVVEEDDFEFNTNTEEANVANEFVEEDPVEATTFATEELPTEEEEDAPLREFEEKWQARLAEKDAEFSAKREEMKITAREDMDNFWEQRRKKIEAKRAANVQEEEEFTTQLRAAEEANNSWERIVSLVDLNPAEEDSTSTDKTRLKNLLIQLKNSPKEEAAPTS